jgi:hypothetical protein
MQAITVSDREAGVAGSSLTELLYPVPIDIDHTVQLACEVGARVSIPGKSILRVAQD